MNKGQVVLGVVVGVVFLIIGYVYWSHGAGSLPTFFPGHETGSSHVHTKHAIASFVVAIAAFVYGWFQSGPKKV